MLKEEKKSREAWSYIFWYNYDLLKKEDVAYFRVLMFSIG